ncbi:neuronal regeneration-related protein isoform X2 [Zalophus californianus]|uniref:Neuronal regeneration-related protein isoform X2 n=1 Tax=Zalophus californianus TaxID=9704 RepID=A0A6J2E0U3_ZALCA|nr:neuronal regeneration-related protein isoform X2 [Zalophus californianus]
MGAPEPPIPAECREERVNRERGFCLFITQSSLSGSVKNHFQIRKWREGFLRSKLAGASGSDLMSLLSRSQQAAII